jgi:hypothetical protein
MYKLKELALFANKVNEPPEETKVLLKALADAQDRCAILQEIVDRQIEAILLQSRTVKSFEDAQNAFDTYGLEWFAKQAFSYGALQKLAYSLSENTVRFLGPNKLWERIASGIQDIDPVHLNRGKNAVRLALVEPAPTDIHALEEH